MKQLIAPLLALAVFSGGISRAQEEARLKIATVDMQALTQEYNRTKTTKAKMEKDIARVKADGEERMKHLQELAKSLEGMKKQIDDPSIAENKRRELMNSRQLKGQELQSLQAELEDFMKRKDRAVKEQIMVDLKTILGEIRDKVQKHAESEGYDYVLDKAGVSTSQVPILLYTKDATDITEVLLKSINDGVPGPDAAEPEKKEGE
ncbi:OmpH family outer membrane protein [Luteolibacter sp. GHJ8]|uniref:OmpH family outer membrane protein n=1 Tax=Luteolibacter rhizosphaerae TaxID=2989719 RepID=A0ABT3G3Q8_9BACT|nr:OmpH family outer membrane protein [Luteolibacter rhizosphaerae]MCW1914471.1 OmpH family outer membrane protein [Luteolibacter rhizosphaerae]